MALNYNQVDSITEKFFLKEMADNIFDSIALLKRAKMKFLETVDGGERILMPLCYAQTTASGWYSGADVLSTTDNQNITASELTWKQSYANITISRREELQNSGKAQVLSLLKSKMKVAERTLRDKWGEALYNDGTVSDAIIGLQAWIATSGTVGGISMTNNSWHQSNVDSSTTVLSIAALQTQYNAAAIGDDQPTLVISARTPFNLYHSLLQPQQRFVDSESAKAGFSSLYFNGIPWLVDSKATASNVFILNEDYLKLFMHSKENFTFEKFQKPVNQNLKVAKIHAMGAFGSNNNRMHARLSAITA